MKKLEDWEYPDPDDTNADHGDLIACPSCGAEIYEDAVRCPECGEYVTASTKPLSGWPWWFLALGAVGVAALLYSLLVVP